MSVLDHPAISDNYLFPQNRLLKDPFVAQVNGVDLACYQRIDDANQLTVVHFHGNGEAVADYVPFMANAFSDVGLNSLFVEYREYGGSTGKAQLAAMLDDGDALLHLVGLAPKNTIVFGRSIGSLYAMELAHRQPNVAGLVLESGIANPLERFLMYADLEAAGIDLADVRSEADRLFNHQRKLSTYNQPLLILHTEHDGLVDISHAERNFEWAATRDKRLVRFPFGNHNSIFSVNAKEYMQAVGEFATELR